MARNAAETTTNNQTTPEQTLDATRPHIMTKADSLISNVLERQQNIETEPTSEELARITHENYVSMFELPPPCKAGDGLNYTWSWCEADEKMIHIMESQGHLIANRIRAPFLNKYINHASGAVTRQRANIHVLMMRSKRYSEAEIESVYKKTIGRMSSNDKRLEGSSDGHVSAVDKVNLSGGYGLSPNESPMMFEADGTESTPGDWS